MEQIRPIYETLLEACSQAQIPILASVVFGLPDSIRWYSRQYNLQMVAEILIGAPVLEARGLLADRGLRDAEWYLARKGVEPGKPREFLVYDEPPGGKEFDRVILSEMPVFIVGSAPRNGNGNVRCGYFEPSDI